MFTMKSQVLGRASVMSDGLAQSVNQNNCEIWRLNLSEILCEFLQISRIILYEIIPVRLAYHNFCARWVPKMLTGAHKTQRIASALTFKERYHKRWR
jgi:hypothetical protein